MALSSTHTHTITATRQRHRCRFLHTHAHKKTACNALRCRGLWSSRRSQFPRAPFARPFGPFVTCPQRTKAPDMLAGVGCVHVPAQLHYIKIDKFFSEKHSGQTLRWHARTPVSLMPIAATRFSLMKITHGTCYSAGWPADRQADRQSIGRTYVRTTYTRCVSKTPVALTIS